ncbi:hypothetical protein EJB05_25644 [Eragrostis curvula]|uniref:DNA 3'-5' helicase n=1 Tax=Eragrostis curvula TaxID=38414 RepID=A0A5J9UHP1_9POAL|nr:hypothetical protein EJB05_25644 [Eragrostis curvula]
MEDEEHIEEELLLVESQLQDIQGQIKTLLDRQEELYERQSQLKALLEVSKVSRNTTINASSVAMEDWSGSFPWDSEAENIRFNIFGITSYRSNQREIINAVMSGRDVLVIMAAGGGKSLCYQLPAALHDGIALVVSPLLSLIQDQVMGLTALGIPAYMLTSTTNKEVEKFIYKALDKVIMQEAHCCSQWGHDFRPDYKNLGILKIQFPSVPMIALTATATSKVQTDLIEMLHIPRCVKFVSTVNRPNLFYKVTEKSPVGKVVIDEISNFISESYPNNESGIVYCFSRKECEQVAFGMGINKPDVRFVIHHSLSKSMETYYQSSMVFYENCGLQNLYDIVRYRQTKRSCRHGAFFRHFGEVPQDCNGMCDNCASSVELKDIDATYHTKIIVSLLHDMQLKDQRATLLQLVDKFKAKWKGLVDNVMSDISHMSLQPCSILIEVMSLLGCSNEAADLKKEEIEQLIVHLILDHVLKEEFQHTPYSTNAYVTLGPMWKPALQGNRGVKLEIAVASQDGGVRSKGTKRGRMSDLEAKLDELRRELSSTSNGVMFPHAVLSAQQISLLSCQKPTTLAELEKVIGKVKTAKYGSRIVEVMRSHTSSGSNGGKEASDEHGSKKMKMKDKDVVCVESSEEE